MADYITEMAQQIVATSRRIDAIESDRVARMAELERTFNAHRESVYDRYNHGSEKFNAALDRIHTLERGEKELYARCQEVAGAALAALQGRDRVARWHATYDALAPVFVGRCIGAATLGDTLEETKQRMEWAIVHGHKLTGWYCDRAHGPLEIVVPAGTTFDAAALAQGGKLVSQPGWSQRDAKVEALVKAATGMQLAAAEMLRAPTEESSRDWLSACVDSMTRCLKPFETQERDDSCAYPGCAIEGDHTHFERSE